MKIRQLSSLFDFERVAEHYEDWYNTPAGIVHDATQKADLLHFLGPAEGGARLLDVGCGTGHWSRFFASLGYAVAALDLSRAMVKVARSRSPLDCAFLAADACAIPFEDASFDVVAAMATIEFVCNPSEALHEMSRCLRHGGKLIIGTLNRLASLNRERVAEGCEPYASARLYSPDDLLKFLRPFGKVRMKASAPEGVRTDGEFGEAERRRAVSGVEGPFIIAEVRT